MQLERFDTNNSYQKLNVILSDIKSLFEVKTKIPLKRSPKELERFIKIHQRKFEKMYSDFWARQKEIIKRAMVIDSVQSFSVTSALQDELHAGLVSFIENEFNPIYQDLINEAGTETAHRAPVYSGRGGVPAASSTRSNGFRVHSAC